MPFHLWKSFYDNGKPVLYLILFDNAEENIQVIPAAKFDSRINLVMTKRQHLSEFLRLQRTKCRTCSYSVKCNVTFSLSSMSIPEDILREKNVIQFASDILFSL